MIENKFLKRFIEWLLVWAPACFTIFIYVPTAVIVGNIGDFDLYYQTIILTQLRNFAIAVFCFRLYFLFSLRKSATYYKNSLSDLLLLFWFRISS